MDAERENIDSCYGCSCEIDIDNDDYQEHNGEIYCQDCFDDSFLYCNNCQDFYNESEVQYIESEEVYVCEDCFDNDYGRCNDCGESFQNDCLNYCDGLNYSICDSCFEEYFCCDGCGMMYPSSYYAGNGYCQDCAESNNVGLHNYSYKPEPEFYGDGDLYFGIELEVESNDNDIEPVVDNLPGFVYAKEDSSLDGGMEIVSHPASWQWLKDNADKWNSILDIREYGFRSYNTDTCGIHIHLSKKAFSGLHLYKFLKLFYEYPSFILTISRRAKHNLERYASLERDESIVYKARTKRNGKTSRYTAVNLENDNTVEIRIFRGTLASNGFWRNIEFCKAVFEFTKQVSIKEVDIVMFCKFVKQNKVDYPNLYRFLDEKDFLPSLFD